MPKPRTPDENRDYQRQYMRLRRAEAEPVPGIRKVSATGSINLLRAGIRKGARYTAEPQGDGAILLTPL